MVVLSFLMVKKMLETPSFSAFTMAIFIDGKDGFSCIFSLFVFFKFKVPLLLRFGQFLSQVVL